MNIPRSDHGLPSELQSPGLIPEDDDKGKQPVVEWFVPQASTSALPIGETTMERRLCREFFQSLIGPGEDYRTLRLQVGDYYLTLQELGMTSDLTQVRLGNMLKLSGYLDENAAMDLESFTVFTEDFKVFESHRKFTATRLQDHIDRGPLGNFFEILKNRECTSDDFKNAFRSLDVQLADESADRIVQYVDLLDEGKTFDQFLDEISEAQETRMRSTGHRIASHRMVAVDMGQRVGRLMAFVSAYAVSARLDKLTADCLAAE